MVQGAEYIASAYVRQGLMPVAPFLPTVVITIRTLEIFRAAALRCPRLTIHVFVHAICDIHGAPPRPYLSTQFRIAFDLYLGIRAEVDKRVQVVLGCDTPNWRLKNACPACLYTLEGEERILHPILCTYDGNNSLSRNELRTREDFDAEGNAIPGVSREHRDERVAPGDYYLSRDEVNRWAKEGLEEMMKSFVPGSELPDEGDGCSERWQNMREDVTSRAYGMYDETGIFPALCRHGFVLVIVDMIKSGEL
jgi:hypothetical protein